MKNYFNLDFKYADKVSLTPYIEKTLEIQKKLDIEQKKFEPSSMLGWIELPINYLNKDSQKELITKIKDDALKIRKMDALVVVGIGGSTLGTRAIHESLKYNKNYLAIKKNFEIFYLGGDLDAAYHKKILEYLSNKNYAVNVISKSGKTIETAIAFRFLLQDIEKRYGENNLKNHIYITTDKEFGNLRKLAIKYNLPTYEIPSDIGGRYSVFTSVALLPLAVMGFDIDKIIKGATEAYSHVNVKKFDENLALQYACYRYAAYQKNKKIEVLAFYQNNLTMFGKWWQQLFGESEGKNNKGIFPTFLNFTSDLHSMGQWLQEGERTIFETVLDVVDVDGQKIKLLTSNFDELNNLTGKSIHEINRVATTASIIAHSSNEVPTLRIEIQKLDEETIGALMYFFKYSCAISALMLGVDPFEQSGVEVYKKNMQNLL